MNNFCYDYDLENSLLNKFMSNLKNGTKVITMRELFPRFRDNSISLNPSRWANHPVTIFQQPWEKITISKPNAVSWTASSITYYVYQVERQDMAVKPNTQSTKSKKPSIILGKGTKTPLKRNASRKIKASRSKSPPRTNNDDEAFSSSKSDDESDFSLSSSRKNNDDYASDYSNSSSKKRTHNDDVESDYSISSSKKRTHNYDESDHPISSSKKRTINSDESDYSISSSKKRTLNDDVESDYSISSSKKRTLNDDESDYSISSSKKSSTKFYELDYPKLQPRSSNDRDKPKRTRSSNRKIPEEPIDTTSNNEVLVIEDETNNSQTSSLETEQLRQRKKITELLDTADVNNKKKM